ncbi:hypothetical protein R1sor_016105 [Riccia sorocarpa]|uniref:Reverse transcriptase RNase H-like domain-containing protein n=1 Tax=Riccia sorocarpa TaxID=122646 RepID=A0ABD3HG30_9MARC
MPFHIHTDASGVAVGAVLAQPQDPKLDLPIYFASRTLNKNERDYTTTEREALAMVYAVKKFKPYLQGNKFIFFVDHQALTYLVNKVEITGRIARWLLLLQEFDFTVVYKPSKLNVVADQLSRLELGREPGYEDDSFPDEHLLSITLDVPDDHPASGSESEGPEKTIPSYTELLKGGWQSPLRYFLAKGELPEDTPYHFKRRITQKIKQYTLIHGKLYKRGVDQILRRCVNEEEVLKIMEEANEGRSGGHGAGEATAQKILHTGLWWPTLFTDCHTHVKSCNECQRSLTLKEGMPLKPIYPIGIFQRWGLDFIGPIKPTTWPTGRRYIITATDYTTKWVEAECYRTNDKKMEEIIREVENQDKRPGPEVNAEAPVGSPDTDRNHYSIKLIKPVQASSWRSGYEKRTWIKLQNNLEGPEEHSTRNYIDKTASRDIKILDRTGDANSGPGIKDEQRRIEDIHYPCYSITVESVPDEGHEFTKDSLHVPGEYGGINSGLKYSIDKLTDGLHERPWTKLSQRTYVNTRPVSTDGELITRDMQSEEIRSATVACMPKKTQTRMVSITGEHTVSRRQIHQEGPARFTEPNPNSTNTPSGNRAAKGQTDRTEEEEDEGGRLPEDTEQSHSDRRPAELGFRERELGRERDRGEGLAVIRTGLGDYSRRTGLRKSECRTRPEPKLIEQILSRGRAMPKKGSSSKIENRELHVDNEELLIAGKKVVPGRKMLSCYVKEICNLEWEDEEEAEQWKKQFGALTTLNLTQVQPDLIAQLRNAYNGVTNRVTISKASWIIDEDLIQDVFNLPNAGVTVPKLPVLDPDWLSIAYPEYAQPAKNRKEYYTTTKCEHPDWRSKISWIIWNVLGRAEGREISKGVLAAMLEAEAKGVTVNWAQVVTDRIKTELRKLKLVPKGENYKCKAGP